MINVNTEELISLSQAAKLLPTQPCAATLWRWHARGINGIKLETVKAGRRRYTSREAMQRFLEAVRRRLSQSRLLQQTGVILRDSGQPPPKRDYSRLGYSKSLKSETPEYSCKK